MACPVCLSCDGGMRACACSSVVHAKCLSMLIAHGFTRCRQCLQMYNADSLLAVAQHELAEPQTFDRLLKFCSAATSAERPAESLATLALMNPSSLEDFAMARFLCEKGRAMRELSQPAAAEIQFSNACTLLEQAPSASPKHLAVCMIGLATCQIDQRLLRKAATTLSRACELAPSLPADMGEAVMRAVASYSMARGNKTQFVSALEFINEIVQAESPDPAARAAAFIELETAREMYNRMVPDLLIVGKALSILRRSRPQIWLVHSAANMLASHLEPARRLRQKTHPENVTSRAALAAGGIHVV